MLTDQGVREQIFSAGITGAGADARRALQRLQAEAEALWRPRGASRVGALAEALDANRRALAAARQAAEGYSRVREREERARLGVAQLTVELEALRGRERHLMRLLEIWPIWRRWDLAREALATAPDPGPFPPDGLGRLDAVQTERSHARQALASLRAEREQLRSRPRVPQEVCQAIQTLAPEVVLQARRLEEIPALEVELEERRLRRAAILAELGSGWNETRLGAVDLSLARAQEAGIWADRLRQAAERAREAITAHEAAEHARGLAGQALEEHRAPWPNTEVWEQAGMERTRAMGRARAARWPALAGLVLVVVALFSLGRGQPLSAGLGLALGLALWGAAWPLVGLRGAQAAWERWRRAEGVVREHEALALRYRAAAREGETYAREAGERTRQLERLETAWAETRQRLGLPSRLRPEGVPTFLETLHRAREADAAVRELARGLRGLREAAARWSRQAAAARVLAGEGDQEMGGPELVAWVRQMDERVREDREAEIRGPALEARWRRDLLRWQEGEAAWGALLRAAGLEPEEDAGPEREAELAESFRRQGARWQQAQDLGREVEALRLQVEAALGEGEDVPHLRADLAAGGAAEATAGLVEVRQALEAREAARLAEAGALREAELERAALEEQTDVVRLAAEGEALAEELGRAVGAYRCNQLAQCLLRQTLDEFMRTRQPDVLRVASGALSGITAGRYQRVVQEEGGEQLAVVDAGGMRLGPERLSRGTAEQLYLALRLGLAASFARRAAALPLIMDDVLVNFDPRRAGQAARVLAAFARGHAGQDQGQVLVFTCHPETVLCLREADPACPLVEMPGEDGTMLQVAAALEPASGRRRRGSRR